MNKPLSKFQKNSYLQLFLIFGNANQLNKYLNIFFQFHCSTRFQDLYHSCRENLFHANWIGINNELFDHLDKIYNQSILNLRHNSQLECTEENWEEWTQIAQYECDLFLYELNQMYQKNRDLEEFGFHFEELVHTLLSNFDEGSYVHLQILNRYMVHPVYGKVIKSKVSTINLDLWKVRCLGQFDDVILEFFYVLKTQFIYAINNENRAQSSQNVECIRTYLFVLQYDYEVACRLVDFIHYLSQLPHDLWDQEFVIKSRRWIPAINCMYQYINNIDESFSELFLNDNEDFYFKYPSQIMNVKVHPIKLVRMRCCRRMFEIFYDYRNQIAILRVINTYLYFFYCCSLYLIKKIIRLPWGKIIIYCGFMYLGFQFFKSQVSQSNNLVNG